MLNELVSSQQHPPEPWQSFLNDIDRLVGSPVELHCFGGFVLTVLYGVPRVTADLDFISVIPPNLSGNLDEIAGRGSTLAKKHRVFLQRVNFDYPDSYEDRLLDMFLGQFSNLRLRALEIHDLVLAKLTRASPKDMHDVEYLAKAGLLNAQVLKKRYEEELRPYLSRQDWHDGTLRIWIEDFFPPEIPPRK